MAKFTRFDLLYLQHRIPRKLLQIPYDLMNRINRKMLLKQNTSLVNEIEMNDYFIDAAKDNCSTFLCGSKNQI